jgi:hypothetical protein
MSATLPHRDGATYDHEQDGARLQQQQQDVWNLMRTGHWYSLTALSQATGHMPQSISARIRDFRKDRFGGHTVLRKRAGLYRGTFVYRLVPRVQCPGESA